MPDSNVSPDSVWVSKTNARLRATVSSINLELNQVTIVESIGGMARSATRTLSIEELIASYVPL